MTYNGNVSVGGPAQTRELPGLTITKVAVGPMNNNAYLLRCTNTGDQLLIDAANEADTLLGLLGGQPLATIVTTHQHGTTAPRSRKWRAGHGRRDVAHTEDAPAPCRSPRAGWSSTATPSTSATACCGSSTCAATRPGSIALLFDAGGELADQPHLFTGDSLFPGGPGNTQKDPVRFSALITDLEDRIFGELPDGTWVYPGHGGDTTLGAERPHVPEWRARGW